MFHPQHQLESLADNNRNNNIANKGEKQKSQNGGLFQK
jgi:hypothetical protein